VMRANSYFAHWLHNSKSASVRGRTADWDPMGGFCITLGGRNIFIENNNIYCSGCPISSLSNGALGKELITQSSQVLTIN
jgi:hypothetical protein